MFWEYSSWMLLMNKIVVIDERMSVSLRSRFLIQSFWFRDQCSFQDDLSFLVSLGFIQSKLIDPANLCLAVLAWDIPYHVSSCQHLSILDFGSNEVDYSAEEEGPSSCSCESSRHDLALVRQVSVTGSTRVYPGSSKILEEYPSHSETSNVVTSGLLWKQWFREIINTTKKDVRNSCSPFNVFFRETRVWSSLSGWFCTSRPMLSLLQWWYTWETTRMRTKS